jgi:membrane associated rhomboid family serine protease
VAGPSWPAGPGLAAIGAASLLALVHLLATAANGFALPDGLRALVGASPETTLSRPWALLAAPFFHDDLFHLGYNLAVMLAVVPPAPEATGMAS